MVQYTEKLLGDQFAAQQARFGYESQQTQIQALEQANALQLSETRRQRAVLGFMLALLVLGALAVLLILRQQRAIAANRQAVLRAEATRDERLRLSREIHDTLLQGFAAIQLHVGHALELTKRPRPGHAASEGVTESAVTRGLTQCLGIIGDIADDAAIQGRRAISRYRGEPEMDICSELEATIRTVVPSQRLSFTADCTEAPDLEDRARRDLVAIVKEAALNARRHGGPDVSVTVTTDPQRIDVSVRDNGEGFDVDGIGATDRYGLKGMRERAERSGHSLTITSRRGATEVKVEAEA